MRVQLPRTWHRGAYLGAKGVHALDSSLPNFVSARCSRPDVTLRCQVADGTIDEFVLDHRAGLDGRTGRLVWVAEIDVIAGELRSGDTIDVIYGNVSSGGRGFRAGLHAQGDERILVSVQSGPAAGSVLLDEQDGPWARVTTARAVEVQAIVPSVVALGERTYLHLSVFDEFANIVPDYVGEVSIRCVTGSANAPKQVRVTAESGGVTRVEVEPVSGVVRFEVDAPGIGRFPSNPMEVVTDSSVPRLYWGDLHSHAQDSADALGIRPYEYAQRAAQLDFYALTEHAEGWVPGTWDRLRETANLYNNPGSFVTFVAYEAGFGAPWGHHNVYFLGDDGPVVDRDTGTLSELWEALDGGTAITIPHHTGVQWTTFQGLELPAPTPDWSIHDGEHRRLIEVYSLQGSSELFDPDHPLSYDNLDFTHAHSLDGPHYAQDAWMRGLTLGVIGSSDDHAAQPGRSEGGLAAVWCDKLDRQSVFDALFQRRTYGTTGSRMIIRLRVNGALAGQPAPWASPALVGIAIHGTRQLENIELLMQDHEHAVTKVIARWERTGYDFATEFEDPHPPKQGLYYLRVTEQGTHRRRAVMGWSSPIWFDQTGAT